MLFEAHQFILILNAESVKYMNAQENTNGQC